MFGNRISVTPFTTDMANMSCTNITGDSYGGDVSFVSTLRALLIPRMPDENRIRFQMYSRVHKADEYINSYPKPDVFDLILPACFHGNYDDTIVLTEFNRGNHTSNGYESDSKFLDYIDENIEEVISGTRKIEKITQFFKKTFRVSCYVNEERRTVYLFTEALTLQTYHYLQCGILAFLPWYFDKEKGLTEDEMSLVESLRKKRSESYIEVLGKIALGFDFRTKFTKNALNNFETIVERAEIERIRNNLDEIRGEIENLNSAISHNLKKKRDLDIRLIGLETMASRSERSEIMEFFLRHPNVYLENVTGSSMIFIVKDYLMFWDEDEAMNQIDNPRSYAYEPNGRHEGLCISPEDQKKLLKEIFIEQNYKIKFCAAYKFDIQNCRVDAIESYYYGCEFWDATPNTHIDRYRCIGDYRRYINEYLEKGDYVGAIEQAATSCRSLAFSDGAVMSEFFARWYGISGYNVNMRCIELPNGEVVDPVGAVEYMHAQEKGEESDG